MIRRWILAVTLSISLPAAATDQVALNDALKLLRQTIVYVDQTPAGKTITNGGVLMLMGGVIALGMAMSRNGPPGYMGYTSVSPKIPKVAFLFPAAMFGLGGAVLGYGYKLKAEEPPGARDPKQFTHYESAEGLVEFMGLTNEQQLKMALDYPEFASFLIELAEAYRFVNDHRVEPFPR